MTNKLAQDPVGAVREARAAVNPGPGEVLDPMRAAAIRIVVERAIQYEWVDKGKNSSEMRKELAAFAETCRIAANTSGDDMWITMRSFFEREAVALLR